MDELFARYPAVIAQMPPTFTSHQFILALAQQNQRAYVEALHSYRENGTLFRTAHAQLSLGLRDYSALVRYVKEVDSPDIFGAPGRCAQWEKL
jgi:hypothetical protein